MKTIVSTLAVLTILLTACIQNQANKTSVAVEEAKVETPVNYQTVEAVLKNTDNLVGENVNVTGVIDHVCKHGGKRFKMLSSDGTQTIKVELGDKFKPADPSIAGKTVKVTGTLSPYNMDAAMIKAWMKKELESHPDEVGSDEFKQEMAGLQAIYDKIESGEMPYYTIYSIDAEKYDLE
jgi:PBP1b-binding outer membrane lipoprotein LpoB